MSETQQYTVRRRFRYGDRTYFEGDVWSPRGNKWDGLIVRNKLVAPLGEAPVAVEAVVEEVADDAIEQPVQQRGRGRRADAASAGRAA